MIRSSVLSYPKRGRWGSWDCPGNFSGHLVRELIQHYRPRSILDPMCGSHTTCQVAREMGVEVDCFDLRYDFDLTTDALPPKRYNLEVFHPPYWDAVKYSDDPRDLSNCATFDEYLGKLMRCIERLAEHLAPDGRLVLVLGNVRKHGQYYPLGAYAEVLHRRELKEELIKLQHNVRSQQMKYPETFIPIMHEKVLVFADFKRLTWRELIQRVLDELGGQATLNDIYAKAENHPRRISVSTWMATIRRTLQETATPVARGVWRLQNG